MRSLFGDPVWGPCLGPQTLFEDPVWGPCLGTLVGSQDPPVWGPCLGTLFGYKQGPRRRRRSHRRRRRRRRRRSSDSPPMCGARAPDKLGRARGCAGWEGRAAREEKRRFPHLPLRSREQLGFRGLSVDLRRAIRNTHLVLSMDRTTIDRWDRQHTSTGGFATHVWRASLPVYLYFPISPPIEMSHFARRARCVWAFRLPEGRPRRHAISKTTLGFMGGEAESPNAS